MNALDKEGRSPLLLAGARGAWKTITALIELGSNVSLRDKCNRNILHLIVLSGGQLEQFIDLISKVTERVFKEFQSYSNILSCRNWWSQSTIC